MLEMAGSDSLTIAWAAEHHLSAEEWTIAADIGEVLHCVDDD